MDHALGSERRLSEVSKVRMRREGTTLILRETPGAMWLLGTFFAGINGTFVMLSVRDPQQEHVGHWVRAGAGMMGAVAVAIGMWTILRHPVSRVRAEPGRGVTIERIGLAAWRPSRIVLRADAIAAVTLDVGGDIDGDPVWRVALELVDANIVPLGTFWRHDHENCLLEARALATVMGLRLRT